jgi:hypothetical protein
VGTTDTTTTGVILVQDTLGGVRTPREKREQILDEYERSGFCGLGWSEVFDPGFVGSSNGARMAWL